jgi:beta-N-acetylhexosaminidase
MSAEAPGTDPGGVLLPGFSGPVLPDWVARRLDHGLAGVCLFGDNIVDPRQLRALTDDIVAHNPRAVIALDEEGGDVTRLFYGVGSPSPGNAWLGRYDDETYTFEVAATIGRQLRDVGCNLNFAPAVDVNSNQGNPVIGVRSFSGDPMVAARHARAWVRGHQSTGVGVSAKHFPGHGDTQTDSHLALPVVDADLDRLLERDLPPFAAAIEAGAWTIMTSHILLPALDEERPATFSPPVLRGLLRDRLGFAGVVVSDALDMAGASAATGIPEAAVRALAGGCDLLCIGSHNTDAQLDEIEVAIAAAVTGGRLGESRLAEAGLRVAELGARVRSTRSPGPVPSLASRAGDNLQFGAGLQGIAEADRRRTASVFDVSERAAGLLQAAPTAGQSWAVVQLQSVPNSAVGVVPWGPHAVEQGTLGSPGVQLLTDETDAVELANQTAGRPLAIVGRDNHRHHWIRALVDEVRRLRPEVLVVDMGWPDTSRAYADIATFGASRLLGAALLDVLGVGADRYAGSAR